MTPGRKIERPGAHRHTMQQETPTAEILLHRGLVTFARDEQGQIGILFAVTVTALLMMCGMAIDYARSSLAWTNLQNAVDAVALGVAREATAETPDETLKQMASDRMATMLPSNYDFEVTSLTTTGGTLTISAEGSIAAGLTTIAGYTVLEQRANTEAAWGTGKLEVALVLDSTGSMAQHNRMVELKKAAAAMLDELQASEDGLVKMAIVPFDVNVKVPTSYKTASWFKTDWWVSWFWSGCIADRDQSNDASDAAVTSSSVTKYPGALCSSNKLVAIQPLTDDFSLLYAKVNALVPAGNTNVTIGLAWGMALLSSQEPFTQGAAPGTKNMTKIIVLMTDGDNTENRWTSSASSIDARTQLACQAAKDAKITLYTIRLMEGNSTLLQGCASSVDNYYDVVNVADLVPAFQAIGEELSQLRLSH